LTTLDLWQLAHSREPESRQIIVHIDRANERTAYNYKNGLIKLSMPLISFWYFLQTLRFPRPLQKIGEARMQKYLNSFLYGNANIGGGRVSCQQENPFQPNHGKRLTDN
jgi:hypothetical protein